MGGNTGNGSRKGQIKNRKQVYNSRTKMYVKINTESNRIMSSKKTPYKGVRNLSKNNSTNSKNK